MPISKCGDAEQDVQRMVHILFVILTSAFCVHTDYPHKNHAKTGKAEIFQIKLSYSADKIISAHIRGVSAKDNKRWIINEKAFLKTYSTLD